MIESWRLNLKIKLGKHFKLTNNWRKPKLRIFFLLPNNDSTILLHTHLFECLLNPEHPEQITQIVSRH
jgi:hypothetical protein